MATDDDQRELEDLLRQVQQQGAQLRAVAASDPGFWLGDAEERLRSSLTAILEETTRIGPTNNGRLPYIAHDLLHILDELTKLRKRGFSMLPPGGRPPIAAGGGRDDNEPMEDRVRKLEEFVGDARERLARIETKIDGFGSTFASKEDVSNLRTDMQKAVGEQTWKMIGWVTGISTLLVAAVFFIAKNIK